jgi:hypothetical protein
MHAGNKPEHTEGCLLAGLTVAKDFVGNSRVAMTGLQPKIQAALDAGEKVFIEITK